APEELVLAGVSASGVLNWTQLVLDGTGLRVHRRNAHAGADGYVGAEILGRYVAAVSRSGVDWLRCGGPQARPVATTRVALPAAVACFGGGPDELLVVCRDGLVARVPVPP